MTAIRFQTEDGVSLEGELRLPDGPARGTAVLCHPDPKYGGSKDHPVLWAIRNDLAGRRGLGVLAFNFRGVMGSEGSHGDGRDEVRDVAAAVDRVRSETDGPTILVGWSFGANVALRHAVTDERVAALVLVAPPLGDAAEAVPPLPSDLTSFSRPVLLVSGDGDAFCPVADLRALTEQLPDGDTLLVPAADHFFGRREREVAEAIGRFVDGLL